MGQPTVLLVEDDADLAEVMVELLAWEGFLVAGARNGRHALDLVRAGVRPDIVVLDLMMPELDGFGFLAEWAKRPEPRPPIVAVSAFEPYLEEVLRAGAATALAKPYAAEDLIAALRALAANAPPPIPPPPPPRADERARLHAVLEAALDEPPADDAFDRFTARVAALFDVPICLVSAITADRQAWHGACGLPPHLAAARGGPREESFCTHAVAARAALVVQDAGENPFFRANRFVREEGLRFYAGVPLMSRRGEALGTLCLIDRAARRFTYLDLELLGVLARRVVAELERREKDARPRAPVSAFRRLAAWDEELDLLGRDTFMDALVIESLRAAEIRAPVAVAVVVPPLPRMRDAAEGLASAFPRALLGRLGLGRIGAVVPRVSAGDVVAGAAAVRALGGRFEVSDVPLAPGAADQILAALEASLDDEGLDPRAE
ncbi:MAG TPA: response regulator [Anaeromyxobacteraceae bacterium]|nr:response regulator [Anaeromyxobacteraceae bacterium]